MHQPGPLRAEDDAGGQSRLGADEAGGVEIGEGVFVDHVEGMLTATSSWVR